MTTCTHLSDRMPDVALGRARWTPDDERHLAGCDDCRAEWAIVRAAGRLGATLTPVDPERTASGAIERIRREQARTRLRIRQVVVLGGLAAAAVVAFAVWGGRGGRGTAPVRTIPLPAPVATNPPAPAPDTTSPVKRPPEASLAQAPVAASALEIPIPELDSLPAEALDSMLRTLDEPLAQVGTDDLAPDESGDQELEQVLAGLEG